MTEPIPELGPRPVSLLWRVLLSTSIAITVLFGALGWVVQDQVGRIASTTIEEEVRASFQAYQSLWQARAGELASVSLVMSRMPDIRAAFGTGDEATIQDTATEVWGRLAQGATLFIVAEPSGSVIAQAGTGAKLRSLEFVAPAGKKFPDQARGFVTLQGSLYQVVLTPVYVASGPGSGLLNVLVVGEAVDAEHVAELKRVTGGSDFVFYAAGREVVSTLPPARDGEYFSSDFPLRDFDGRDVGKLSILRSLDAARTRIDAMRGRLIALWAGAVLAGLGVTLWLTRRLLRPLVTLSHAAAEIGRGNYHVHVPLDGGGEIRSLAESFNTMSDNLSQAREELIRQERISTIGRLSTSIVHDLRNPLAAIYGGSEMLVDRELSQVQVQRLAANIYSASRKVQEMLQELADVSQGRGHVRETCRLRDVVEAGYQPLTSSAEAGHVDVKIDVPADVELPLDRSPMERVFQNLIVNAIEAMPGGGVVKVSAETHGTEVLVRVDDTGPGIPHAIATELFQPFVTAGKPNGLGLGLALSRKTVLSHGGDLWLEPASSGARFRMRLPA
jgi:signal transduction histidine kinase